MQQAVFQRQSKIVKKSKLSLPGRTIRNHSKWNKKHGLFIWVKPAGMKTVLRCIHNFLTVCQYMKNHNIDMSFFQESKYIEINTVVEYACIHIIYFRCQLEKKKQCWKTQNFCDKTDLQKTIFICISLRVLYSFKSKNAIKATNTSSKKHPFF